MKEGGSTGKHRDGSLASSEAFNQSSEEAREPSPCFLEPSPCFLEPSPCFPLLDGRRLTTND